MDDRLLEQLTRIADALDRLAPAPGHQPPEPAPADDDGATAPAGDDGATAPADDDGATLADLRAAVKTAAGVDRSRTVEILAAYGAKRAPDVAPEQYADAIRDLQGVTE